MTDHFPPPPDTPPTSGQPIPAPPAEPPAIAPAVAKRTITPLAAGAVGLALGAAIVGGIWGITAAAGPDKPATFTLKGEFELTEGASDTGSGCQGTDGYEDIAEGTSVTVYGAGGDVIATGYLGDSKTVTYGTCKFTVAVDDVPKGEKFYKVEVSHRGTVQLSAAEAEAGQFASTLG